jgi:hypothetical protein
VAGDVVLAEKPDGETFGAGDRVGLVAGQAWDDCESADVGQMLLKFILGSAFHAVSPLQWPLALEVVTFSKNRNSTIVVKDAGY